MKGITMNPSDHDLLIQLITKVDILEKIFTNHLHTHATYTIMMFSVMIGALGTMVWRFVCNRHNGKTAK